MPKPELLLATRNKNKFKQLKDLLNSLPFRLHSPEEYPLYREPVEDGSTYLENARIKAYYAGRLSGIPCLSEDSGLEITALQGKPGIESARYASKFGLEATTANNIQLVLEQMKQVPPNQHQACFKSVVVYYDPETQLELVGYGTWMGVIINEPRGHSGFGYDPIFYASRIGLTGAEMDYYTHLQNNHRFRALRHLITTLVCTTNILTLEDIEKISWWDL